MKESTATGMNRTGAATAPRLAKEMVESSHDSLEVAPVENALAPIRTAYATGAEPVGTMPPPASLKGLGKTAAARLKGERANVLLDKLGERAAFERSGARLYQAVLDKMSVLEPDPSGPSPEDLAEIEADERRHFMLVTEAIRTMGGDPTVMTPCADLTGVASMGFMQVVTDPRTSLRECLEVLLKAELLDNEGWAMLIELADGFEQTEMAEQFREAEEAEAQHLARVRGWVAALVESAAFGEPQEAGSKR
jgi:ferritin-like protein